MRDLPTDIRPVASGSNVLSFARRAGLAARSLMFWLVYFPYLLLVFEPLNWLVIGPLCRLYPSRRRALVRFHVRAQADIALTLIRILAGVRFEVRGALPPVSSIVVMNHQSVLDILFGVFLIRGPYPLIPTRASYASGIPGISSVIRLMRCPLLTQRTVLPRKELRSLLDAADQVARGEQSLLIYPEGHRSRSGVILPFMKPGLSLMLRHARQRPVYVVVADGLGHVRTFRDMALRLSGSTARIAVLGPYNTPAEDVELDPFIDGLRSRMIEGLAELRTSSAVVSPGVPDTEVTP